MHKFKVESLLFAFEPFFVDSASQAVMEVRKRLESLERWHLKEGWFLDQQFAKETVQRDWVGFSEDGDEIYIIRL